MASTESMQVSISDACGVREPKMGCIQIPSETLSGEALRALIEEFVSRDGTDYGLEERTLAVVSLETSVSSLFD